MKAYKNKKTGAVLETESKITGDNWELVKKRNTSEDPKTPDPGKDPEE